MHKIELIYFSGCPHVEKAKDAIRAIGVIGFSEVKQDSLPSESSYRLYSSPTILVNGKIAVGSINGAAACSMIDWNAIPERISALLR